MDSWFILQIILDIYLCGFIIYYIFSYRRKEHALLQKQHLRETSETKKINETLKGFLENSESVTFKMVEAFRREHQAIRQSINQLNLKMEELNNAAKNTKKLLDTLKEEIPSEDVRDRQNRLRYAEASNLLKKGFAPGIVAEKMKLPIGEIELVSRLQNPQTPFSPGASA